MNRFRVLLAVVTLASLLANVAQANNDNRADGQKTLSDDGSWCWFSDPRAVSIKDKVYAGWVASDGSIMVGSFNTQTGESKKVNLFSKFNKDDHANPSLLVLPDNRIMAFFSSHNGKGLNEKEPSILYATTKNPEDITEWEPLQRKTENVDGPKGFCYTNPVMLSKENNRIYIFWRGADWKPTFCYTDDFGLTWTKSVTLVKSSLNKEKRPYVKVSSNGWDEIYIAFTDGHPRNEPLNSIYFLKYKSGKFYRADGTVVGDLHSLPIEHEKCDVVYDAENEYKENQNGVRAWIWDVAADANGSPVIAYTRLPEETKHQYFYAKWNGSSWVNSKISEGGSCFPRYPRTKEMRDPEPHYSGGVCIDFQNPNIVYFSKPVGDIFEIFKAETDDGGKTWNKTSITKQSLKDNVRPFVVRKSNQYAASALVWMYNERYFHYKDYDAKIRLLKIDEKKTPSGLKK